VEAGEERAHDLVGRGVVVLGASPPHGASSSSVGVRVVGWGWPLV
jgi:hypothetical protein